MNANAASVAVVPYLRKITPKSVAALQKIDLLALPRPDGKIEARVLYDLVGTVFDSVVKPDRSGTKQDSVQFKGEFQACNIETGEVYAESGVMYVPVMDAVLHTTLQNALSKDPKARLAVALRVGIVPAPTGKPSATGYEFDVQRLIPTDRQPDDPITRLKAMAKEHRLALAGPSTAGGAAKADEPAPAHNRRPK